MKKQSRLEAPLIGITPDIITTAKEEPILFLQERYTQAILDSGGVPVVLSIAGYGPSIRRMFEALDGIVVSGGNFDIDPRLYGEERLEVVGKVKEERTEFELELISLALARDLPLLGVCGGAQAINVALGGSLYQDIATQVPHTMEHQRGDLKEQGGHKIKIHDNTKLKQIVGREQLEVNTTHHQAVKRLGKGLIVNATAEDGIIEGIESPKHFFVLGLQWHPEFLAPRDLFQRKIFAGFISASKEMQP